MISKLRHYVDLDTLKNVYYSLIYPYLYNGAIIWENTYQSRLNQLNILNNKAVRIIRLFPNLDPMLHLSTNY